jgi:hypothetical protein
MKKKLENLTLEELHSLYSIVGEICADYSKMTDNYSLTSGDNMFEHLPDEVKGMINDRQLFVSYKLKIKEALINKIKAEMENYE